eukprot:m.129099 g.129099  ORF g.129099 m.129099 type:complete len:209 (-) comp19926_c0_seq2:193-819(-)
MPKKMNGGNEKAMSAKARKDERRKAEAEAQERALEDAKWQDNDKNLQRKQQRQDEKMKKQQEVLSRKAELRSLAEEEELKLTSPKGKEKPKKVTRASIAETIERQNSTPLKVRSASAEDLSDDPLLQGNPNLPLAEDELEARSVDDALQLLNATGAAKDRKMKTAFAEFRLERTAQLQAENPGLRESQLRNLIAKEWRRSARNPANQK